MTELKSYLLLNTLTIKLVHTSHGVLLGRTYYQQRDGWKLD